MLIYPVGAEAWSFLDKDLPKLQGATLLRFIVTKPLPAEWAKDHTEILHDGLQKQSYNSISQAVVSNPDSAITKIFQRVFGIEYERLLSGQDPVFFLFFLPSGCEAYELDPEEREKLMLRTSAEHDLVVEFLQANGAEVYSTQAVDSCDSIADKAWSYFCEYFLSLHILIREC